MCMGILTMFMSVYECPLTPKSEEDVNKYPKTVVSEECEPPYGC